MKVSTSRPYSSAVAATKDIEVGDELALAAQFGAYTGEALDHGILRLDDLEGGEKGSKRCEVSCRIRGAKGALVDLANRVAAMAIPESLRLAITVSAPRLPASALMTQSASSR